MKKRVLISTQNVSWSLLAFFSGTLNLAGELIVMGRGASFKDEQITIWFAIVFIAAGLLPPIIAQIMAMIHHWPLPETIETKKLSLPTAMVDSIVSVVFAGLVLVIGIILNLQNGIAFNRVSTMFWFGDIVFGLVTIGWLIILIVGLIQRWRKHKKSIKRNN